MSLSANYPALAPNMLLDFANTKTVDPRITVTRASTATYFNQLGVLTSAANNVPRIDFNPTTYACNGLLVEESRTNLLLQSQTFQTTWTTSQSSVSADATTAPDGTTTADKLVENTATAEHYIRQTTTASAGATIAFSVFVKAAGRTSIRLRVLDSAATSNGFFGSVDTSTGATASGTAGTGTLTSVTATALPNGWYRLVVVGIASPTATTTINDIFLLPTDQNANANYTGDGTSGAFLWGAQLEAGAFATSYIPTVAATVTRQADVISMTGTAFSGWYNAVAGTLYTEVIAPQTFSYFPTQASLHDGSDYLVSNFSTAGQPRFERRAGGVTAATMNASPAVSVGATVKQVIAYAVNDFALVANAGTPVTSTSGNVPSVTSLRIGGYLNGVSAGSLYNGWLRRISYYPLRNTNAQLQALTGT